MYDTQMYFLYFSSVMNSDRQRKRKLSGSSSPDLRMSADGLRVSCRNTFILVFFVVVVFTKLTILTEMQVNCFAWLYLSEVLESKGVSCNTLL